MKRVRSIVFAVTALAFLALAGCGGTAAPAPAAGTPTPPAPAQPEMPKKLVIGFVPSQDASKIPTTVKPLEDYLTKALGIPVETKVGTTYITVVEGMGSKQIDFGWLNTLSYVLAHDQYGVQVALQTARNGSDHYRAQIIALKSKNYKSIQDLKGATFGWVDAASTSGYLYPAAMFKQAGIDPDKFFASTKNMGTHPNVATGVYNGDIDAGACFDDCRSNIVKTNPDVKDKIAIVAYSDNIPNDTVSYRKDLPKDLVDKFVKAVLDFSATDEGKATNKALYSIDGYAKSDDSNFNVVRDVARFMNIDIKAKIS